MTQLFVNPEIDDYFVEYDFRDAANRRDDNVRQKIIDDYAGEKVVLLRNLRFDADLDFLRRVTFYQKWKWKKLPLSGFETIPPHKRRRNAEITEFVRDVFRGDWGQFDYFLEQATLINDQLRAALDNIFDNYRFSARNIVWRFTETRVENLHFDVDRNCDDLELIRLYVNLDDIPRIWYTSGTFTELANEWYSKLELEQMRGQPYDKLLAKLNTGIFGDWNVRGRDKVPRHLILFEPGDVWLTDGRLVSHQVIYGRRVVSTLFMAESRAVPDSKRTFAQKVADLHSRQQEIKDKPGSVEAVRRPPDAAPALQRQPVDLMGSWEKLAAEIRQNRLVRM